MLPDVVPEWFIAYHPVFTSNEKRTLDGKKTMNVLPSIDDILSIFFLTLENSSHKLFIKQWAM